MEIEDDAQIGDYLSEEHEEAVAMSSVKVKVRCPVCGSRTYKPSIEAVLRELEEMWKPWKEYLSVEERKLVERWNSVERLEKIVEEKGELLMFCPVCVIALANVIDQQLELGKWKDQDSG